MSQFVETTKKKKATSFSGFLFFVSLVAKEREPGIQVGKRMSSTSNVALVYKLNYFGWRMWARAESVISEKN